jgi:hypothetical protein
MKSFTDFDRIAVILPSQALRGDQRIQDLNRLTTEGYDLRETLPVLTNGVMETMGIYERNQQSSRILVVIS